MIPPHALLILTIPLPLNSKYEDTRCAEQALCKRGQPQLTSSKNPLYRPNSAEKAAYLTD